MSNEDIYAAPQSELENPEHNFMGYELASRGARLGAAIIDSIIGAAVTLPVMFATGIWDKALGGSISIVETVLMAGFGFLMFILIHGYFLMKNGQTVGKKIVGTKIVSVDSNKILPFGRVLVYRYLPITVASNFPVVGQLLMTIDTLFILGKSKRCVHDQIAGTRVIRS